MDDNLTLLETVEEIRNLQQRAIERTKSLIVKTEEMIRKLETINENKFNY